MMKTFIISCFYFFFMFFYFHFVVFRKKQTVEKPLAAAFTATVVFAAGFYLLNRLFP